MTFLSVTPDTLLAHVSGTARARADSRPASRGAHLMATLIVAAALFVPGAVVQAKWNRLGVVLNIVQQRCLTSLSV